MAAAVGSHRVAESISPVGLLVSPRTAVYQPIVRMLFEARQASRMALTPWLAEGAEPFRGGGVDAAVDHAQRPDELRHDRARRDDLLVGSCLPRASVVGHARSTVRRPWAAASPARSSR